MPVPELPPACPFPRLPWMFRKGAKESHKTLGMKRRGEQVHFVMSVSGESHLLTHREQTKEAGQWGCPPAGCSAVTHGGLEGGAARIKPNKCIFTYGRASFLAQYEASPTHSHANFSPSAGMCGPGLCRALSCGHVLICQW